MLFASDKWKKKLEMCYTIEIEGPGLFFFLNQILTSCLSRDVLYRDVFLIYSLFLVYLLSPSLLVSSTVLFVMCVHINF